VPDNRVWPTSMCCGSNEGRPSGPRDSTKRSYPIASRRPHIGLLLVDFERDLIGLHVNGDGHVLTPAEVSVIEPDLPEPNHSGRRPEHWVEVHVHEAYIHCSKHIPKLVSQSRVRHWGTDNPRLKGGDHFGGAFKAR
jgi:uncharacterized protein